MDLSADDWATGLADEVYDCKLRYLAAYLEGGIAPREGVLETIALCKQEGVGLGLIADSSEDQVQLILGRRFHPQQKLLNHHHSHLLSLLHLS